MTHSLKRISLKRTDPESQITGIKEGKDLFSMDMKRTSMSQAESNHSLVSVSSASSRTNLSESSKQHLIQLEQSQVFPSKAPSLAYDSNTCSTENLELPFPCTFDISKAQSEITLTNQSSLPQEKDEDPSLAKQSEYFGLAKPSSVTTDSLCQMAQECPDDQVVKSSDSSPTPPESGSPQLDQLLSDLEEMKLKFRPEILDLPLPGFSNECPEVDQVNTSGDLSPEEQCCTEESDNLTISMSSAVQLVEDKHANEAVIEPATSQTSIQDEPELVSVTSNVTKTSETSVPSSPAIHSPVNFPESLSTPQSLQRFCEENSSLPVDIFQSSTYGVAVKFPSDIPEEHLVNLCEEDSTTDILQHQAEHESATSSKDLSIQDQLTHLWEETFGNASQAEDISSQSLSDLTPETVTSARHFSFDELMPYPSPGNVETSSDEDKPKTSGQHSEESLTPVDPECLASKPIPNKLNAEMTSSVSDDEYSMPPGYAEISSTTSVYTHMSPEYKQVAQSGADSPTFESSDPEPFFDCIQAASDASETESDEPESKARSNREQSYLSHPTVLEKGTRKVLLSSGSEDYEDAPFVHEPLYNVLEENEELLHYSETSDEEFTLCEASQPPPVRDSGAYDDTDKSLAREITAELGSMSESSDDEFLTTRIVRRRVVIQADEMPDFPTQSVMEEKYKDENGHIVVKKITRKIIRKGVSADGVAHEERSSGGASQESISMAEGDGFSKVVKRTVLKSEGDHTEVTFAGCEGLSASGQEKAEVSKVSRVERTTVVKGERTMTHQGDPSLASDLPSAQEDFKQALSYIGGFSRTKLPHVVERETVKEDGTVVRRAHMRKGHTRRRTVVKGTGQCKQVLDDPRKGSKPCDLQQHLHQLFHRYYEEEKDNDEDEEEEEEEERNL